MKYPSLDIASEIALSEFAEKISRAPLFGLSIGLAGPLGAGKTTFVRHVARHLGSRTPVSSPTFPLLHEYEAEGRRIIEHWDLYRLNSVPEELWEVQPPDVLRIIEWADKFPRLEAMLDINIAIQFKNMDSQNETRVVDISCRNDLEIDGYIPGGTQKRQAR